MNCNEAVRALIASVEAGDALSDGQREHIRTCERCRELLEAAKLFEAALDEDRMPEPQVDAAAVETAVRREHIKSVAIKLTAAAVGIGGLLALMFARGGRGLPELAVILAALGVLVAVPATIIYLFARSVARQHGRDRLYKRLGPGRQISGVCSGIAEATGVNVTLIRMVFVVLFFFKGVGILIYILFDLVMPVHPADREYLWRFKARRLLARIRGW